MPDVLELIAEPNRRKIMRILWKDERSAGDIASQFDVSFGAVSQHLLILRNAGLIKMRKAGRTHFYRARQEALGPFAKALEAMWSDALGRLKSAVESEAGKTRAPTIRKHQDGKNQLPRLAKKKRKMT